MVGLGNPGPKYAATRHNAGFWLVDRLAQVYSGAWGTEARAQGEVAKIVAGGRDCRLLKPTTYVNRSGYAVAALARYFKIPPAAVLVAYDDLDLPPGAVRLRLEGGHGGHNGMRDCIAQLGTREFPRLRFGIGHPGNAGDVVNYVLSRPAPADREAILSAIDRASDVLPLMLAGELEEAMKRLHTESAA